MFTPGLSDPCPVCGKSVPDGRIYCSNKCVKTVAHYRARVAPAIKTLELLDFSVSTQGPVYTFALPASLLELFPQMARTISFPMVPGEPIQEVDIGECFSVLAFWLSTPVSDLFMILASGAYSEHDARVWFEWYVRQVAHNSAFGFECGQCHKHYVRSSAALAYVDTVRYLQDLSSYGLLFDREPRNPVLCADCDPLNKEPF